MLVVFTAFLGYELKTAVGTNYTPVPEIVSPAFGIYGTSIEQSMFMLPITTILFIFLSLLHLDQGNLSFPTHHAAHYILPLYLTLFCF